MEDEVENELSRYLREEAQDHASSKQLDKAKEYVLEQKWLLRMPNHSGKLPFHIALQCKHIGLQVVLFLLEQWPQAAQIYMKCTRQLPIAFVLDGWDEYWKISRPLQNNLLVDLVRELAVGYPDGLTEFNDVNQCPLELVVKKTSYWPPEIVERLVEVAIQPTEDDEKIRQRVTMAFKLKTLIHPSDQHHIFFQSWQDICLMTRQEQRNWLMENQQKLSQAIKRTKMLEEKQSLITEYFPWKT